MPLTITKLKMWKNPGYTRECVEVPPRGSWKMPAADYVASENLRPRKGSTLTAVELPLPYLQVMDMSYMYIEVEDGVTPTPNTVKLFGWIVSIEEIASSAEAVRITWTVDYWRSYSASAVFGAGMVTRCSDGTHKRPYMTKPRMMTVSKKVPVFDNFFGFLLVASETTGGNITGFTYYWMTLNYSIPGLERSPTLEEAYSGKLDEILGLTPSSIIGAWIVPDFFMRTAYFTGTTNESISYQGDNIVFKKSTGIKMVNSAATRTDNNYIGYVSDDMNRCIGTDPYGNITSTLPWGFGFTTNTVKGAIDISTEGVTFYVIPGDMDEENALANGTYLSFSGLPIPLNTNAWSEYAYTYQRSYDKRMAEISRNQRAVTGLSNVGQSAVGGAIAGATSGAGIAGAVAGAGLGLAGPVIDYFASGYFNDELQTETDKLISNQTSNLLTPGGGLGWRQLTKNWRIVQLTADSVSSSEYSQHIANDGYTTEIPVTDATSYITTGGPLQIQNLILTGSIPPAAKTYIKNILSNGVRIVENNPSGVNP